MDAPSRVVAAPANRQFSNGLLTDRMPVEVVERVMSAMSVPDMACYAATSMKNYSIMYEGIQFRLETLLAEFGVPPEPFMDMLRVHRAVISGSMALRMLLSTPGWQPNDMDVYVPRLRARRVIHRLRGMGFVLINETTKTQAYRRIKAIASVTKLTNGHRSIDVIESSTSLPFDPIFKFHLTAVMNFLSSDGFFSAYPKMTNKLRSLKNPIPYLRDEPSQYTRLCYEKYEARGFQIAFNSKGWENLEGNTHHCRSSWRCPHTIRSMYDGGCLFVPFHRISSIGTDSKRPFVRCFQERRAVVWHLGGERCEDWYEPLRPFSTNVGAYATV